MIHDDDALFRLLAAIVGRARRDALGQDGVSAAQQASAREWLELIGNYVVADRPPPMRWRVGSTRHG